MNITPPCIKALYQIPDATLKSPGNSLGLFEQGSYFNKQDLDSFYAEYAPYVPQGTYPVPQLIDGANFSVSLNSSFNSGEANIDIDMAYVWDPLCSIFTLLTRKILFNLPANRNPLPDGRSNL